MINANATRTARDRKVTYSWDGPAVEDDKTYEGYNHRITLEIVHDKDRKCYKATLYKVKARTEGGYTMVAFDVFGSPSPVVLRKPVARFGESSFSLFESEVLDECDRLIAGGPDGVPGGLAGLMLDEALGYSGTDKLVLKFV